MALSVSRVVERTSVLGPGIRAGVWVRGCPLRCAGCVSPEDLTFEGGRIWDVRAMAARLNALPEQVTGVTFSGGEPMAQAAALAELVDRLRAERDWSVMSYSGFTLERLRARGDPGQRALLERLDILVDGPYLVRRHADLLWRASTNQRLHFLTDRHTRPPREASAGIELVISDHELHWVGVPGVPGFRAAFEEALRREGVLLERTGSRDVT